MRSSFLTSFGVGLLAGSVHAGPCKPHSTTVTTVAISVASSSLTFDVPSSTIVFSIETAASSTILESDVTEATTTTADTATTTDVEDTTTTEISNISEATTSAVPTTITSEATTSAIPTTTTSEATTSAIPTTTTSEAPWPLETFALVYSQTSGPLMGILEPYNYVNFGTSSSPLGLTIEPGTDRLRIAGGLYLCTFWEPNSPGAIITCENEEPWQRYIECAQAENGELSCTGEVVLATRGPRGLSYASTGDYVTQFLVQQRPNPDVYSLFLGDGPMDGFTSVTLKAVQAETQ